MRINQSRTSIVLIGATAIVVALAGLAVSNLARIRDLQNRIADGRTAMLSAKGQVDEMPRLQAELDAIRRQMSQANRVLLPANDGLGPLLRNLSNQIAQEQLVDQSIRTLDAVQSDNYTALPIEVAFRGRSLSALRFVRHVEQMDQLVQLTELSLVRERTAGASAESGEEPVTVQAKVTMRTFVSADKEGSR